MGTALRRRSIVGRAGCAATLVCAALAGGCAQSGDRLGEPTSVESSSTSSPLGAATTVVAESASSAAVVSIEPPTSPAPVTAPPPVVVASAATTTPAQPVVTARGSGSTVPFTTVPISTVPLGTVPAITVPTPVTTVAGVDPTALATVAVQTFYAAATDQGDLDAAWQVLTPARQQHFSSFDRFSCIWGQFASITLSELAVVAVSTTVASAQFTASYVFVDGTSAVEQVTSNVVVAGGTALIDTETSTRVSGSGHLAAC